ncbi:DUF7519 family protein [Halobacteriaceae archaeon SHR40]|uniref:DUF7519 family protein n=1 Tax=Halovenus amylolytica TaxID=2500550 RepID=UPI000FE36FE9
MKPIDRSPAIVSSVAATALGLVVLAALGPFSGIALGLCVVGFALLAVGLLRGIRSAVSGGAGGLLLGTVAGAVNGAPVLLTLLGLVATVLAWDVGQRAIDIGEQLGRDADTSALELFGLATSVAVGVFTGVAGYLIYLAGAGGQPLSALFFVLLAVLVLFAALRREPIPSE